MNLSTFEISKTETLEICRKDKNRIKTTLKEFSKDGR